MRKILFILSVSLLPLAEATVLPALELKDGDRVALIGDVFIERAQEYGHLELALTTAWPKRHTTFRNLGWSGDTPRGVSRAGLSLLQAGRESGDEGWKQLQKQIELVKPTVVFLGYGMASSFEGQPEKFRKEMQGLIDVIRKIAGSKTRFVILSPIRHEAIGGALPNPAKHNSQLAALVSQLRELATTNKAHFVSLFNTVKNRKQPLTDNGIHANSEGYRVITSEICRKLGVKLNPRLGTPEAETLRVVIRRKNKLFFDRSRPQNMAYIFGFRKHEQGRNAVEIPQFDPLIEEQEKLIAARRDLAPHSAPKPPVPVAKPQFKPQPIPQFDTMPGIEVTLFAENPQLAKPIQMNFDPEGRLWVATSSVYPQVKPGQVADDKIVVLQDTTGDGKADKTTVFADGLFIPTGIEPGDGGAYVAQSTELLHFRDIDGDGRADKKQIVLSGFGTEDTHHTLHTLRWGHDGRLYFNQSIYIRSHLETPHGVERLKSGGIWHLRPDTLQAGIAYRGWCNPWGHHFDDYGQSFVTDGAGFQGISYAIPGAMYFTYAGGRRIMGSISPGNYPKFAGLEILNSPHFPESFRGAAITCDFRAHRIVRFTISESGAGFEAKHEGDFIRSSATTFRPIDVKQGPDGALYIADWSNPIIQHGEVDFRDPRRDKIHGRIWRVTFKDRPLTKIKNFGKLKNEQLFDVLLSDNQYEKRQARRVLQEKGKSILSDLSKWTAKQAEDKARLEAMWLYETVNQVNEPLLRKLLASSDPRIRAASVRVLNHWKHRVDDSLSALSMAIADKHPRVRLEAARGLEGVALAASTALRVIDQPMDRFLDYGLWLTINEQADRWMAGVLSGEDKLPDNPAHAEFALKAIEPGKAARLINQLVAKGPIPKDGKGSLIELVCAAGGARELSILYKQLQQGGFERTVEPRVLSALARAAYLRNVRPSGDLAGVGKYLKTDDDATRNFAVQLAGAWKRAELVEPLLLIAAQGSGVAFDSLVKIRGSNVLMGLKKLAAKDQLLATRQGAARALGAMNLKASLPQVLAVLKDTKETPQALNLWRALLSNKNAGNTLAGSVLSMNLPKLVVTAGIRAAREGGRNEKALVSALARSQNIALLTKQMTPTELKALAGRAMKEGDPFAGEKIYRRAELACTICHAIGGAGGKVGPDFTSLGTSAQPDYIIESLWYPNRKIKEGYHTTVVETKDGRSLAGVQVRDAGGELVLRDLSNKLISIPKNQIRKKNVGLSLMTPGLIVGLAEDEQLHLYRFLAELGKAGPFDTTKTGVARTWKLLPGTHRVEQYGIEKIVEVGFDKKWSNHVLGVGNNAGWSTLPARVNGDLPSADMLNATVVGRHVGLVHIFAGTNFQVQKQGKVTFNLPSGLKTEAWINGQPLKRGTQFTTELKPGKHRIVIRLDAKALPKALRLESKDVAFLND